MANYDCRVIGRSASVAELSNKLRIKLSFLATLQSRGSVENKKADR